MSLKDATYNINLARQGDFDRYLVFRIYKKGKPWTAYRQFCQHFLAPLALMSCRDVRLNQLLRVYIDGVPLDLASGLLPIKAKFNFGLFTYYPCQRAKDLPIGWFAARRRAGHEPTS